MSPFGILPFIEFRLLKQVWRFSGTSTTMAPRSLSKVQWEGRANAIRRLEATRQLLIATTVVVCGWMASFAPLYRADEPAEPVRQQLHKLLQTIETNDYDSFVADATDTVKAALTRQMLAGISGQLAPRLKKGYDCTYLAERKQQDYHVYLWKMVFKDGGDDILAKLSLKETKVAGFLLQ